MSNLSDTSIEFIGGDGEIIKVAATLPVSLETLYDGAIIPTSFGFRPPLTPEERAEREREEKVREARRAAFAARLTEVEDPVARVVLDLHVRDEDDLSWPTCAGCDFGGYEGEPPAWPCSTVKAITNHLGIEIPEGL